MARSHTQIKRVFTMQINIIRTSSLKKKWNQHNGVLLRIFFFKSIVIEVKLYSNKFYKHVRYYI